MEARLDTGSAPAPDVRLTVHRPPARWRPDSWRSRPAAQQPDWPDERALRRTLAGIAGLPPLVTFEEILALQRSLAGVAAGGAFLLQAGDCAEQFSSATLANVRGKLRVIQQLAVLLTYGSGLPVVTVGRIAGQYAKPRSRPVELVDGRELPVYRGDMVNSPEPTAEARRPNPARLRTAYERAATTLDLLRELSGEGGMDLARVHEWNRDSVRRSGQGRRYERISDEITLALRFMAAFGERRPSAPSHLDLFTSHEALLPDFEHALTRQDPETGAWFATSAHMLWIGDRTRQLDGAHLEFMSGVSNPIGVKVGPTMTPDELRALCESLDPQRVPGRLTLITRMGAQRITELLPPLVAVTKRTGHVPAWVCDPMHGNTFVSECGLKTRRFDDILGEITGFFQVHEESGTHPGGLHLELTGDTHVTECLGGATDVQESDLGSHYETACDPRLNADQVVELGFRLIADVPHHPWCRPEPAGRDEGERVA